MRSEGVGGPGRADDEVLDTDGTRRFRAELSKTDDVSLASIGAAGGPRLRRGPPTVKGASRRFATALDCRAPTAPDGHDIGRAKPARQKRPARLSEARCNRNCGNRLRRLDVNVQGRDPRNASKIRPLTQPNHERRGSSPRHAELAPACTRPASACPPRERRGAARSIDQRGGVCRLAAGQA